MLGVSTDKQCVHVVCVCMCALMMMNSSDTGKTRVWEVWEVGQTVCMCVCAATGSQPPPHSTAQHSTAGNTHQTVDLLCSMINDSSSIQPSLLQ